VSLQVQELLSLQGVPSGSAGFEQSPLEGLQVPAEWQASWAVHTTGFVPLHVPYWHVSARVQALPSLQGDPLGLDGFEQVPVERLHVPAVWHESDGVHTTGLPPLQTPAWQESFCVQRLPSLQVDPSGLAGLEQSPVEGLQVPT
jgi:hypothetical protein